MSEQRIRPVFDVLWLGNELRHVILEPDGYDGLGIYTQKYKRWTDFAKKQQISAIGRKQHIFDIRYFFGKLHVDIQSWQYRSRGISDWEQEIFDSFKNDTLGFFERVFGHAANTLAWPVSVSKSNTKHKYDWELPLEMPTIDLETQARAASGKLKHVLMAQNLLEVSGYADVAKVLTSTVKSCRSDLRKIIELEEISAFTPEHEIPRWYFKTEECKKRKLALGGEYTALLEEPQEEQEDDDDTGYE